MAVIADDARPPFLFLDVDGVLLPFGEGAQERPESTACGRFPEPCLVGLARIMRAAQPHVVLSSTWRCSASALKLLREGFAAFGEPLASIPLSSTTNPRMHSERQWEIADWLQAASAKGLDVSRFCVLDDEECIEGKQNDRHRSLVEGRCVLVQSHLGISNADVDLAIDILTSGGAPHAVSSARHESRTVSELTRLR